jgi:hypothetical protein
MNINKKYCCLFALLICSYLISCSSIPKQELGAYSENFTLAKTTTQDIILLVKIIAESETPVGHESEVLLEEKINSLNARIEALELISIYNDILVSLASGTDPSAVYGSFTRLSTGLTSFGSSKINSLVESVLPYGELFSQAVSLIDNAIKAEKFKEAVDAAHKPILGIIDILIDDADDLFEIQYQTVSRNLDIERDKIIEARFDFQELVNSFKASEDVEQLLFEFNGVMQLMNTSSNELPEPVVSSSEGNTEVTTTDLNIMKLSIDELFTSVQNYNSTVDQLKAMDEVKEQYKIILQTTSESFENLHLAIQQDQYLLPIDITIEVLNLRKAYLKLQEAKR